VTRSSPFSPLSPETMCATLWCARYMQPSAAQHFCGQAGGTTKKAVIVVREDREARPYTRSCSHRRYRYSEAAFLPRGATGAPTAKTTPPETGKQTRKV